MLIISVTCGSVDGLKQFSECIFGAQTKPQWKQNQAFKSPCHVYVVFSNISHAITVSVWLPSNLPASSLWLP